MKRALAALLAWWFVAGSAYAELGDGPSHVYRAVGGIVADINALRRHLAVNQTPREPTIQVAKTPLHAYTKGLELYQKVARLRQERGMPAAPPRELPASQIAPSDVLGLMGEIRTQLQEIKAQVGLATESEIVPLELGKTPSDVYEHIWRASYAMDGLVNEITPTEVFRNTTRILSALQRISAELEAQTDLAPVTAVSGKKPLDVNIEAYHVLYQFAELQRKLQMKPLRVPSFPEGNIRPSDVFDTTNGILAESVRVNMALGIRDSISSGSVPSGRITPNDVFANMHRIRMLLTDLTRAI